MRNRDLSAYARQIMDQLDVIAANLVHESNGELTPAQRLEYRDRAKAVILADFELAHEAFHVLITAAGQILDLIHDHGSRQGYSHVPPDEAELQETVKSLLRTVFGDTLVVDARIVNSFDEPKLPVHTPKGPVH